MIAFWKTNKNPMTMWVDSKIMEKSMYNRNKNRRSDEFKEKRRLKYKLKLK